MNWKRVILWSLPLWVLAALLFGVQPLSKLVHDRHTEHAAHKELAAPRILAPLPPEELAASDLVRPETLFVDRGGNFVIRRGEDTVRVPEIPPHVHHEAVPNDPAAKHWVDRHLWILDYTIEYGHQFAGLLLAIGQVVISIRLRGKKE